MTELHKIRTEKGYELAALLVTDIVIREQSYY